MGEVVVVRATVCFREGETSFTFVGVREYQSFTVVDLTFRSAGVGGKLFAQLKTEIIEDLRGVLEESNFEVRDGNNLIPFT